jgi:hypothetical protein
MTDRDAIRLRLMTARQVADLRAARFAAVVQELRDRQAGRSSGGRVEHADDLPACTEED